MDEIVLNCGQQVRELLQNIPGLVAGAVAGWFIAALLFPEMRDGFVCVSRRTVFNFRQWRLRRLTKRLERLCR